MLRYGAALVGWLFALAVYYRSVAPGMDRLFTSLDAAMGDGPLSTALISQTSEVVIIYGPLILTAGIILVGYLTAVGLRGTSGVR